MKSSGAPATGGGGAPGPVQLPFEKEFERFNLEKNEWETLRITHILLDSEN